VTKREKKQLSIKQKGKISLRNPKPENSKGREIEGRLFQGKLGGKKQM